MTTAPQLVCAGWLRVSGEGVREIEATSGGRDELGEGSAQAEACGEDCSAVSLLVDL